MAYALGAAVFQPLTVAAAVAVLLPGVALLLLRARRPVRPLPPAATPWRAATLWLGLAAAGAAWWLVALLWGNDADHPTLSLLLDPVLDNYPGRALGYLAWLATGRWLATR